MGNTNLFRREAEMTDFQPHSGDSRHQELRSSPFWSSVTEAPEVIFDLFQGDEGIETPLPNDSLKASLSPPVGGRFRSFRRDWRTNKCSNNVLNIITNGYILPFITKPKLARVPLIHSGYKAH